MYDIRSIDECQTLQEITDNRRHEYEIHIANKDDYEGVLVDIYEKPTHFVYELLQNADDALATKVKFEITESELRFCHNGSKDFSLADIKSITGVNNSTKKNTNSVGKFGVGFKSVFSITETPIIYNRKVNFRIEHMIIPYEESSVELGEYTTIFKLPFKSKKYTNEKIVEKILNEFENLDCATIMFLHNITTLELPNRKIEIKREKTNNYESIQDVGSGDLFYRFKDSETNVSIAYKIHNDSVVPCENLCIYSFLPTKTKSNLSFYIDAPFDLATTRESIDFDKTRNKNILIDIEKLFESTLITLKNINYLNEEFFYNILPLRKDYCNSEIYNYLFNSLVDIFTVNNLLPTVTDEYVLPEKAIICSDWLMVDLIGNYKKSWLDIENISSDVRNFLIERLGVEEVSVVDFARYVSDNLSLNNMNNDWLKKFYLLCSKCNWLDQEDLKQIPILKTRKGEFKSAYLNEEEQVFRPSDGLDDSKIINYLFLNDKNNDEFQNGMRELLRILDVKERTPRQMIEMTILSEWDNVSEQEKTILFKKICNIYNKSNKSNKEEIVKYLKDKDIFRCIGPDDKIYWQHIHDNIIMQGNSEQRLLFKDSTFLDPCLWEESVEIDNNTGEETISGTASFCRAIGITTSLPIKISESYNFNYNKQIPIESCKNYNLPTDDYPKWWVSKQYYIDDFQTIIDNFSSEKETVAMVKLLSILNSDKLKDKVSGTNGGSAYTPYLSLSIPSDFIRRLKNTKWIIKNGKKIKPYELSIDTFTKNYNLTGNEEFLHLLGLRDSGSILPAKERRGAKLVEDCSDDEIRELEEAKKRMRSRENKTTTNTNDSKTSEEDILNQFPALGENLTEEKILLDIPISEEDIFGNSIDGIAKKQLTEQAQTNSTNILAEKTNLNSEFNQALGDFGEKRAQEILAAKYHNGETINWYGGVNKGYDYSISLNGEDICYIDVKTTSNKKKILVTPSEWNKAKIKKEKYSFLIIDANNGTYSFINNPYQLYVENKINIEVRAILFR